MTLADLTAHTKFLTGQDGLTNGELVRLFNFALDDYSYLALTSSGRWKFDDSTHENDDGDETFPIATATLQTNETSIPLEASFLMLNQVQLTNNEERYKVVEPTDVRAHKDEVLRTTHDETGMPKYYDYDAHSMFFYPASDRSRTVKILYSRASPHFSTDDMSATLGIPRIHNEYLSLHASDRVFLRTNDQNRAQVRNELQRFEEKIRDFYGKRDQDSPRRLKGIISVPK